MGFPESVSHFGKLTKPEEGCRDLQFIASQSEPQVTIHVPELTSDVEVVLRDSALNL